MTENNIIEGLEALMNIIKLSDEKYISTSTEMLAGALNLIYNLKAEKEALIAGQQSLQKALARAEAKVESKSAVMETMARCIGIQEKEIGRLNIGLDNAMLFHSQAAKERDSARAEIEHLKKLLSESEAKFNEAAKRFYKEGVRDFQRKMKDNMNDVARITIEKRPYFLIGLSLVDTVAKDLVGDAE